MIAPDLLGHGDSDKPRTDYSLGAFASGLRDLLEHLGHERVTVVGHSLGGGVAMQFAYQYSEHCERLVLVSSGGLGREVSWALRAGDAARRGVRAAGDRQPLRPRCRGRGRPRLLAGSRSGPRPSVAEAGPRLRLAGGQPGRTAFVHTLRSVVEPGGQRVSATDRLYLAEGRPTLIVWGALDTVIPVSPRVRGARRDPGQHRWRSSSSRGTSRTWTSRRGSPGCCWSSSARPSRFPIDRAMLRERIARRNRAVLEQQEQARTARD